MSPEERRALLGDAVVEHIHTEVIPKIPPPSRELIEDLRRIFARPAPRTTPAKVPADLPKAA